MSLTIQFLDFHEGFTRLEEKPVKTISPASKVFELVDPMKKTTKLANGDHSFSHIHFLRLDLTDRPGIYNVFAYNPNDENLKLHFGLADVTRHSDPYLFD